MAVTMTPSTPHSVSHPEVLVIGYGNTLRGDDAVGYEVAEAIATWNLPHVQALAVHQLTPELAEAIAPVSTVIFIDAAIPDASTPAADKTHPICVESAELGVIMTHLSQSDPSNFTTHVATPNALLWLVSRLYDTHPTAYQVTIPGICFAIGEKLSTITVEGKEKALNYLNLALQEKIDEMKSGCLSPVFISIPDVASRLSE